MSQNEIQAIAATMLTIERLERYYNENFYDPELPKPLRGANVSYAVDAFNDIFNSFDHDNRKDYKDFEQLIFATTYEDFCKILDPIFIDSCIDGFESS